MLFNVVLGDKTDTTLPARGWVVEDINDLEFLLVDIHEFLEVIPEKDIFFVDIGVNKGDGGAIERVPEGGTDDLNHGRDTGTTSNHAQVADDVGGIDKVAFGALDADIVTNLEEGDVAGNVAFFISLETWVEDWGYGTKRRRIYLDDEVEAATVVVVADGGVATGDEFTVDLCGDGDVLANRQA